MNTLDAIYKRRSIRKYAEKIVEKEKLETLLKAAMAAPSACNNQPWEFVVVTEKSKLGELKDNLPYGHYNTPAAIVVCGNMNLALPQNGGRDFWIEDCSAAVENILIEAVELELGTVWIGVYPVMERCSDVSKVLNIPSNVIPLGVIYVGYPDEEREPRTQYNASKVYWQEYGK